MPIRPINESITIPLVLVFRVMTLNEAVDVYGLHQVILLVLGVLMLLAAALLSAGLL